MTLKSDGWPWKITGHFVYTHLSFVHNSIAICGIEIELSFTKQIEVKFTIFGPCDLQIGRMILTNNMTPLLCNVNPCAWFRRHLWIQIGVMVRKCQNWDKYYVDPSDPDRWPMTSTFCIDIAFVNGNYSWQFHDDTMIVTLWQMCEKGTDGQTDGQDHS